MIIVSACLAGINCNYKGESKPCPFVTELVRKGKALPVCPEQLGGLSTPRTGAEINNGKVFTKDGKDVTANFEKGANEVLKLAKEDLIVEKNTYDAFTNPKLNKFLKKERITNILITGVFGEGCVQATINGGFSKEYNMTIIEDFIETRDDKKSQQLLSMLKKRFWAGLYGYPKKSGEILKEMSD